jgi:asparagine synthase (glutamine-hydrolysing)
MRDFALTVVPPGRSWARVTSGRAPTPPEVSLTGPGGLAFIRAPSSTSVAHAGAWTCVARARLDNRQELADQLEVRDRSDARVLLACHDRWGVAFPGRLLGEFAFALWQRDIGDVIAGTDCFGHCPLYFLTARNGTLHIDTDLPRLLSAPDWDRRPDERAIVDYLAGFDLEEGSTAFLNVRRVPPGNVVCLGPAGRSVHRYWRPEEGPAHRGSAESCAAELRDTLATAVADRISRNGRTAVMLSGGLDSSAVACLAAKHSGDAVLAVSGAFPRGSAADEAHYQHSVVASCGLVHHAVPVLERSAMGIREALEIFGHPFPVGGHWIAEPCLTTAATLQADVVLTGLDGDRVVSHGHGHLAELTAQRKWSMLAMDLMATAGGRAAALRQAIGLLAASTLPAEVVRGIDRARRRRALLRQPGVVWLRPDVLARSGALDAALEDSDRLWTVRDHHLRALSRTDRGADLEVFAGLQRTHGVEVRHPFFDRRVVELCLALPAEQKRRRGVGRWVLREALRGLAPDEVRLRLDKTEFDAPFGQWAEGVMARSANKPLCFSDLGAYLGPKVVEALVQGSRRGPPVDLRWRAMVVCAWLQSARSDRA